MAGQTEPRTALDLPSTLAYLYKPILPLLKKIQISRKGPRRYQPQDILLPEGYSAEVVATGFNAPVHCCFDERGNCYVTEAGHKVGSKPRILKVNVTTGACETYFDFSESRWHKTGAVTGTCWHQGYLYMMNTDTLSRIGPERRLEDIVTGLPGLGDHQANYPVVGPDGKIYFGVGSATNLGVVGADNFAYEWLADAPTFHDTPAEDITLVGRNYEYRNVLGSVSETVRSGAYVPFGTETAAGQIIKGNVKCTGSVLRCNPDGSDLELVAWGLRNPYGIAFHPDGRLFVTEHGSDERGGRFIIGDYDDFYEIKTGEWYGWPDFASGIRLDDPYWGEGGQGREPVLAEFPNPAPPIPFVSFNTHAAANGVDFCRDQQFGFVGDAFIALFGDLAPITTARLLKPEGYKVARVDIKARRIVDFAVNKIEGPASKLPHNGFERPSHCQFGPDGALYVVDWGQIEIAPEVGGIRMKQQSGSLWRIKRSAGPRGNLPPPPAQVPLYALEYLGIMAAVATLIAAITWLISRLRRR